MTEARLISPDLAEYPEAVRLVGILDQWAETAKNTEQFLRMGNVEASMELTYSLVGQVAIEAWGMQLTARILEGIASTIREFPEIVSLHGLDNLSIDSHYPNLILSDQIQGREQRWQHLAYQIDHGRGIQHSAVLMDEVRDFMLEIFNIHTGDGSEDMARDFLNLQYNVIVRHCISGLVNSEDHMTVGSTDELVPLMAEKLAGSYSDDLILASLAIGMDFTAELAGAVYLNAREYNDELDSFVLRYELDPDPDPELEGEQFVAMRHGNRFVDDLILNMIGNVGARIMQVDFSLAASELELDFMDELES